MPTRPSTKSKHNWTQSKSGRVSLILTFCLVASCAIQFDITPAIEELPSQQQLALTLPPPVPVPTLTEQQALKTQETITLAKTSGQIANPRKISKAKRSPQAIVGLNALEIAELFGSPTLLRREQPAEIWQYQTSNCVLDVFFYPNKHAAPAVTYFETRGTTRETFYLKDRDQQQDCLRQIARR